jgi:hypothetical protein
MYSLVDHLLDRALLAMVVDGHLHPCLPVVVPDGRLAGQEHEAGVLHVGVVEEGEGDRQHALALEVVHVLGAHGVDGVVPERVHGSHAASERVDQQVIGHGRPPLRRPGHRLVDQSFVTSARAISMDSARVMSLLAA